MTRSMRDEGRSTTGDQVHDEITDEFWVEEYGKRGGVGRIRGFWLRWAYVILLIALLVFLVMLVVVREDQLLGFIRGSGSDFVEAY